MPLIGTRDMTPMLAGAPALDSLDSEAWEIAGVETLQVSFEIDDADREGCCRRRCTRRSRRR